jgi:hypothetical protein
MAGSEDLQFAGSLLLLTARAAADARAHENGRSSIQADTLEHVRSTVREDPFGPRAGPLTPARARTYSAELGRLGGHQRVDAWLTAATAWDRLTRPHDSAYCRWRAADVALREGQAPIAARLLKRAAADARQNGHTRCPCVSDCELRRGPEVADTAGPRLRIVQGTRSSAGRSAPGVLTQAEPGQ